MKKTVFFILLFLLLIGSTALAGFYEGKTVSNSEVALRAPAGGTLEHFDLREGDLTDTETVLGYISDYRVFSDTDGIVNLFEDETGILFSGVMASVAPQRKYIVMATSDKGYNNADVRFVHTGELLYIRCTTDGSHLARGIVTAVSGSSFDVEVTGGDLFIGETVYLYRTKDYAIPARVGMGTAVAALPHEYSISNGYLRRLAVADGQAVERGQLLYTWSDGSTSEIIAPIRGIVRTVLTESGDQVTADQILAWIVPDNDITVQINIPEDELHTVMSASQVTVFFASDAESVSHTGRIIGISHTDNGTGYSVMIRAEDTPPFIGLTADVSTE